MREQGQHGEGLVPRQMEEEEQLAERVGELERGEEPAPRVQRSGVLARLEELER